MGARYGWTAIRERDRFFSSRCLRRKRSSDSPMSAGKILVVDDEPQIRRVMRMTLTGEGYEVEDARSGEETLEKIRAGRFDLMLLDWNLPGMGGLAGSSQIGRAHV